MYYDKDIVKEGTSSLYEVCSEVKLPLSKDEIECLDGLLEYLIVSENEELCQKYNIRPGVGIAAPQVGVNKRMFAINCNDFLSKDNKKYFYTFINPKIIERSKSEIYLPNGEGCLSVVRDTEGLVTPRSKKITIKALSYDYSTKKIKNITMALEGYPAIVFQHEYDHLDGILYTSKMYKPEDLKNAEPLFEIDEE